MATLQTQAFVSLLSAAMVGIFFLGSAVLGVSNLPAMFAIAIAIIMSLGFVAARGRMTRPTLLVFLFLGYNILSALIFGGINSLYAAGIVTWIANEGRIFLYFWPLIFALECLPQSSISFRRYLSAALRIFSIVALAFVFGEDIFDIEVFSSNHAAGTLCISLMFYHYFHFDKNRSVPNIAFLAISFVALLGTNSRTALITFFLAMLVTLILEKGWKGGAMVVGFGLVALWVMPILFQSEFDRLNKAASNDTFTAMIENFSLAARADGNFEVERALSIGSRINLEGDGNLAIRGVLWGRAFREAAMSPIAGIGFGRFNDLGRTFAEVPFIFYPVVSASFESASDFTAHNSLLHLAAELGLMGLGLFGWIIATLWRGISKSGSKYHTDADIWRRIGRACILSLFFMSITQHSFGAPIYGMTLMLLVGLSYRMQPRGT